MAVAVKKYKLFKVCKELNVGIDTIRPFLKEKGIKVSGPNTSIPEEIYQEILKSFSREKEIADQLHFRKSHSEDEDQGTAEKPSSIEEPEKSIYVQAIERSIEERMEEIIREEEVEKSEPVKTKSSEKKETADKNKEIEAGEEVVEKAREIIDESGDSHPEKGLAEAAEGKM